MRPNDDLRAARGLGLALLLALVTSVLLALFGRRLPAPLGTDAPAGLFSAGRALVHLEEIARAPHPVASVESEEHRRVREYLLAALRASGVEPEELAGEYGSIPLTNLTASLAGSAPSGLVLCLAHYDSVPSGPGAGDDGIGVVCWLEALRALRASGWRPRNDVALLLTDGEELGLLGAHVFAAEHLVTGAPVVVINLEAIGNGGPAVLFQTGPQNGALIREFARAAPAPAGTSLADAIYRRMPNDTDLTVFLDRGIGGYNLALTSGSPAHHAPHDTPENLDPVSVQHMGETALALLGRMSEVDLASLRAPDATYFDLLGWVFVRYPAAWDGAVLALGVLGCLLALARSVARRRAGELEVSRASFVIECALASGLSFAAWWLVDRAVALFAPRPSWVPGNYTSATVLALGLVLCIGGLELLFLGRRSAPPVGRMLSALGCWSLAAVAAWITLPGTSASVAWPLVSGSLGLLFFLSRAPRPWRSAGLIVTSALSVLLWLPLVHVLVQLFQRDLARTVFLASLALAGGSGLLGPQLWCLSRRGKGLAWCALGTGLALLLGSVMIARVLVWRQGSFLP